MTPSNVPPPAGPWGGAPPAFAAFVVTRTGDAIEQQVTSVPFDDLSDGDVVVRVDWSSINYKDGMVTRPGNRVARMSPLIGGVDLVGTVVSIDPAAGGAEGAGRAGRAEGAGGAARAIEPGQEVIVHGYDLGVAHHGGFAELARVPAEWVVPLPDGLSARHAAIIGTAGFTAALSLRRLERHGLAPDQGPVLVTGASGGVGSMAVTLLATRGYDVVASTGKAAEHPYLSTLGAASVIGRDDLVTDPGRTLGTERWAGAVDCVGGSTLGAVLRTLRYGSAVAASGLTGGTGLESSIYPFIVRDNALLGIDSVRTPIGERRSVWHELATAYPHHLLDDMVADEIGLEGLPEALSTILAGGVRGRILVRPAR